MSFIDLYSLTLHRVIAEKMITDGDRIIRIARSNLQRWLESESFAGAEGSPLREWKSILDNATLEEICRIITADTDEGQRLRSSSPFTGILSKSVRERYWSECAEVSPV